MKVKAFGLTDVGKRREKNEDSFLVNNDHLVYAVADGMGGHLGGDFASRLAANTLEEVITSLEEDPDITLQDEITVKPGEYQSYLRYGVKLASKRIFEKSNQDSSLHGMGTTMVAILVRDNKAYVANVGDSRAYRVRGDQIIQITRDHSLVGEQLRAGILSEEDARVHRYKNIITRSVGFQEDVEADIEIRVLRKDDRFVLCSDGLSNMVRDEEILDVMTSNEIEQACRRLVDIANERGGDDNITVVAVEISELDAPAISEDEQEIDEPTIEA